MLDGRVLEASQVAYKPFGKTPLKREVLRLISTCRMNMFLALRVRHLAAPARH